MRIQAVLHICQEEERLLPSDAPICAEELRHISGKIRSFQLLKSSVSIEIRAEI